jgi:hypothetical protein
MDAGFAPVGRFLYEWAMRRRRRYSAGVEAAYSRPAGAGEFSGLQQILSDEFAHQHLATETVDALSEGSLYGTENRAIVSGDLRAHGVGLNPEFCPFVQFRNDCVNHRYVIFL